MNSYQHRWITFAIVAAALTVGACGEVARSRPDAGGPLFDCSWMLDAGFKNLLVVDGQHCVFCNPEATTGETDCEAFRGSLVNECRAFCRPTAAVCYDSCRGKCEASAHVCDPGQRQCSGLFGFEVCDPACASPGQCR